MDFYSNSFCNISNATGLCAWQNYNTDLADKCSNAGSDSMMIAFRIAACTTCLLSAAGFCFNFTEGKKLHNVEADTPTQSQSLSKAQLAVSIANFCISGIWCATMLTNTPFITSLNSPATLPAWLEHDWKTVLSSCKTD